MQDAVGFGVLRSLDTRILQDTAKGCAIALSKKNPLRHPFSSLEEEGSCSSPPAGPSQSFAHQLVQHLAVVSALLRHNFAAVPLTLPFTGVLAN